MRTGDSLWKKVVGLDTDKTAGVILVVDDNPLILTVLRNILRSADYEVVTCENGQEALQTLEHQRVDLILCDVLMPKMDGYSLHRAVRSKSNLVDTPFVFLTALDQREEIEHGKGVGADDYLTKPFEPTELLSVIKGKILRARAQKEAVEERFEGFRKKIIHTLSHELRTPLVGINTGTELLLEQGDDLDLKKTRSLLEAIRRGGERLERMVNDFITLQQLEAGVSKKTFETRAVPTRVRRLIDTFAEIYGTTLVSQGFNLDLSVQCSDERVLVYEAHVYDILERLIQNAMKFSLSRKKVELSVAPLERDLHISVGDYGRGIEVSRIRQALEVFGQLDRDKLEQQGGGLGLPIATRYAEICNGSLEFANRPEGGTIVTLKLPLLKGDPMAVSETRTVAEPGRAFVVNR